MSSTHENNLTPNAIRKMVSGKELSDTFLVVEAFPLSPSEILLYDGTHHVTAAVVGGAPFGTEMFTALINAYVVSEANAGSHNPFLCISDLEKIESHSRNNTLAGDSIRLPNAKIQGGKAPTFLHDYAPYLSNEDLRGKNAVGVYPSDRATLDEKETRVADFLAHHQAINTLHNNTNTTNTNHDNHTTQYYMSALSEFQESQMDRQKASLTSNAGRENAERSVLIVEQHSAALKQALNYTGDLYPQIFLEWHGVLCGRGIHPEAGSLRQKGVHVGHVAFCSHRVVPGVLDKLCHALNTLQRRLLPLAPVTFAAAVFFGIVDLHPFADGNGRLARIAANWALRKAGIPFCIHLFATPSQRKEYTDAIVETRRNINLVARGECSQESLLAAFGSAGALAPLVNLILDRLSKATIEFGKLVQEKSVAASEEREARAARLYREKAAQGTCIICFDDRPNIATLCCGRAIHLNCMAEWLSSRNSCPQCRAEMPSLPERMRPPAPDDGEEETSDTFEEEYDEDDTTSDDLSTHDESSTQSTAAGLAIAAAQVFQNSIQNYLRDAHQQVDDTSSTISEDRDVTETENDDTTTENDDDTNSATLAEPAVVNAPPKCRLNFCHNRAARDCVNSCCGRCCVLYGDHSCPRHF